MVTMTRGHEDDAKEAERSRHRKSDSQDRGHGPLALMRVLEWMPFSQGIGRSTAICRNIICAPP